MATVGLPLTGAGDSTANVAVDLIGADAYQRMKLHSGADGSTVPVLAKETTPGSADGGLVVRPITSTGFNQAVVGSVGLTSGSSQVGITSGSSAVELTSAGSTRLAGRVTVDNPTTAVNVANPTTAVTVSSGVVLGAGSSANMLGAIALTSGTQTIGNLQRPSAAARTNVAAATADSTLLAPNSARMGAALVNDVNADCYVGLSTVAASTSSYTVKMGPGGYYELPFGFTGGVRGFWLSTLSSGSMRITELTS